MPAPIKILLLEDDADDIEFLKVAFEENDLRVSMEVLTRGDLITSYLASEKPLPDLIVMDLNLPKMHGREVLCMIREHRRFDRVPLAVVTTSSLEEDKSYCNDKGANRYFVKPSSPEGFDKLVNELYRMGVGQADRKR